MNDEQSARPKPVSIALYLIVAAVLVAFIKTFSVLSPIILSFLLTVLISLALNPVVTWLRTFTGGRKAATAVVFGLIVLFLGLTGWAFYNPLKNSITNLTQVLPTYWERLQKPLIKMETQAARSEEKLQEQVKREIGPKSEESDNAQPASESTESQQSPSTTETAQDTESPSVNNEDSESESKDTADSDSKKTKETTPIRSTLGEMLQGVIGSFTAAAVNGAQIVVVLVTVFFGVIFMLLSPKPIICWIFALVPERHHDKALVIMQRICRFAPNWGGSTLAGMLAIGLLVFLLMWPILGLMDALILGLIAGMLEAVPFLGPTLSVVPALLLAFGQGGMTPVWVLLAYIAVQILENNVILPMIMARGMKLHAVAVIFSMFLCVAAFGVLGVLVAAPLVAIVSIVHEELYRKQFLPTTTQTDLERLAWQALHEGSSDENTSRDSNADADKQPSKSASCCAKSETVSATL